MVNYYDILEIDSSSTSAEIKKAYHRLARQYHPDKNQEDSTRFQEIQKAYEVLSDPEKRLCYDEYGVENYDEVASSFIYEENDPVNIIFDEIFMNDRINFDAIPQPEIEEPDLFIRKTEDMNITVKVSLQDLYQRKKKRITFNRIRNGEKEKFTTKIAIEDGIIILPGESHEAEGFQECGDVVINIETLPHPKFTRINDYDLTYTQTIPLAAAYQDYFFTVEHLDNHPLYLMCPSKSVLHGKLLHKLEGYGLPISKLDRYKVKRGDLYIEYQIQYPESLKELRKIQYNCTASNNQKAISIKTIPA